MLRLRESVAAISAALELTSQESSPISWAVLQYNLAWCYFEIAKRQPRPIHVRNSEIAIANALAILGPLHSGSLPTDARRLGQEIGKFDLERAST